VSVSIDILILELNKRKLRLQKECDNCLKEEDIRPEEFKKQQDLLIPEIIDIENSIEKLMK